MTLKDPSGDEPWLDLTLGPSQWAVQEYEKLNKNEGKCAEDETPKIFPPSTSNEMTLVDPSDDKHSLRLTLGRINEIYCQYCARPFYDHQAYGGHTVTCKSKMALAVFLVIRLFDVIISIPIYSIIILQLCISENHLASGGQKFFCQYCAKDFRSLESRASHMGRCAKRRK